MIKNNNSLKNMVITVLQSCTYKQEEVGTSQVPVVVVVVRSSSSSSFSQS